jgi:type VI secretion system secreted protein VgrG
MSTMNEAAFTGVSELRQHNRLLRLSFPNEDGPSAFMLANRLEASEGLSRDFEYNVEVISNDPSIALKDAPR